MERISQPGYSSKLGIAPRRFTGMILAGLALAGLCAPALTQESAPRRSPEWRTKSPQPTIEDCNGNGDPTKNPNHILPPGSANTDLRINGVACVVDGKQSITQEPGIYLYRNVNIYNGGSLSFNDAQIDFHAHSILVEMNSTLEAGGTTGLKGPLTIWLWGTNNDDIASITCLSDAKNQCGVPDDVWNSNPTVANHTMSGMTCTPVPDDFKYLPKGECFYQYEKLDPNDTTTGAYFGRKVLAVSAGGTLMLRGAKGIRLGTIETSPADSSTSWVRLNQNLHGGGSNGGETSFYVDRPLPTWGNGDHIVVTATDYLPGHTEEFVISNVTTDATGTKITIDTSQPAPMNAVQNPHWGQGYDYSSVVAKHSCDPDHPFDPVHPCVGPIPDPNLKGISTLPSNQIETRAIVALLTRSIRIASEGAPAVLPRDPDSAHFPATANNYYGGHTIIREAFNSYEVQGVEFYQLGQGGAIGRYPIHFHMDRSVPQPDVTTLNLGTYVADCSIVDSMTRFITVHATQGVTLARNVGYKSIGHGFYLEDATEMNNRLYS
ncbi:MAG: hypothetical protein JOZ33_09580, partial [Acidobacteriaceae bacterium]|nr:hypothetical protein [Acidobacteriaceae bacterium]